MTTDALPQGGHPPASDDARVIALIGFAHGISHFFHLLLPPLFPWLMPEFGLSFIEIGATMTMFFVVSGLGQAMAGFAVDRFGALNVLLAGISCFLLAGLGLAFATSSAALFAVAALAGLGNAVFHPADFTVLNRHVSQPRLGHAFSVHGLSGNLGWAAAPVFLTGLASTAGWRVAAAAAALVAIPAMLLLWKHRELLDTGHRTAHENKSSEHPFAFLGVGAVWFCFVFFFLITTAFGAIQNFATPILQNLYGLSLGVAAGALSTYLLGGAVGIVVGGFLAQRQANDRIIAIVLSIAALLAVLLAMEVVPSWAVLPLMAGIGFFTGIAGPSRDLLVRRAAMARFGQAAYGRIYGFVYSGLDTGLAVAPLVFGGYMDRGQFATVLVGVALLQGAAILTALKVARSA